MMSGLSAGGKLDYTYAGQDSLACSGPGYAVYTASQGHVQKQEAGLMKLASIIRTVSAPLATDALGVLAC
jgi:hypothetical protein